MSLIAILVVILVLCVIGWLFLQYVVPAFPAQIRPIIIAIAALVLIVILLSVTGLLPDIGSVKLGK